MYKRAGEDWSGGGRLPQYERSPELAHRFGVEMPITEEIYQVYIAEKTRARQH